MRSRNPDLPLRGDEGELFRTHNDWLVRLTRRRLGSSWALAEEACAHAWLQLCRSQPERENVIGWLRVVALHEGFRLMQQAGREPLAEDVCRQERQEGAGGKRVPLEELLVAPVDVELAVEAREALRALAGLRWRRRRVLALKPAGYRYEEIAGMLGVTYTNVNRHVTEGRAGAAEAARSCLTWAEDSTHRPGSGAPGYRRSQVAQRCDASAAWAGPT
jgi:DNA-directed RNA polymerase specialized sigma24 family protein